MNGDVFRDRLMSGEKIMWSGAPQQGVLFVASDMFLVPFSLLWAGFVVFWEMSVLKDGAPGFFALWGIPFVVMGAYITVGRFLFDAWLRSRTAYAVTSQRILIVRSNPFGRFLALALDRLPSVALDEKQNGRGTITFGERPSFGLRGGFGGFGGWSPSLDSTPRFLSVENAKNVFDLIQRLSQAKAA